jgi:hypothetical protein
MADYHPLIARAVAGLEKNTGDGRRTIYERARTALVAQLRSVEPPLNETDITRERLALEEAIRKVETEAARKARSESARADAPAKVRAPDPKRWEAAARWDEPAPPSLDPPAAPGRKAVPPPASGRPSAGPPTGGRSPITGALAEAHDVDEILEAPAAPRTLGSEPPSRGPLPPEAAGDGRSPRSSGARDFRDLVSEANQLGDASARAGKSARESFDAVSAPEDERHDRMAPPDGAPTMPRLAEGEGRSPFGKGAPPYEAHEGDFEADSPRRSPARMPSFHDLVRVAAALLVVLCIGGLAAWQWPALTLLYRWARTPAVVEVEKEAPPTTPRKIGDRLDPGGQQTQPQVAGGTAPGTPAGAAVAQRVVLYEEDPAEPQGKRFVGSAIWRTETISPGPGRSPELAVRADVEIPERKLAMTWSLRRNTDQGLPASHTVEIMFKLPPDFPAGSISNVPGILMKQTEQSRGVPLAGLAVKVTNGYFLIGLSSADADRERNVQLLKERPWFDIPVVYTNNRRAILALEKGTPGERAFADAFNAWGQ